MANEKLRRVVITGMGVVSPIGIGCPAFWESVAVGKSGTGPITLFQPAGLPCRVAAEVKDFSFTEGIGHKDRDRVQRAVPMTLAAVREAALMTGIDFETISDEERRAWGVLVGTGAGGIEFAERQYEAFFRQHSDTAHRRVSPYSIVASLVGMVSSEINMAFRLYGPSHVVSTGCTSSTDAMGYAFDAIRLGRQEAMVTGGVEACITYGLMAAFCRMGTVTTRWNHDPEHASRPFNADRDGFVLGEGAYLFFFEELERAQSRGARILAEVVGYGSTCDAYHRVQIAPTGIESARAMQIALDDAGLETTDIDYINLHGTATRINDKVESAAVRMAFGEQAHQIPCSSTKSLVGHPQGASGAAGLAATLLAMQHQFLPPTANLENPDPECDLDYIPNVGRSGIIRTALCNCIAFGSKNSALVVKRYEAHSST
ncbi:MAG: beta-ketoacyl-[acyl-carrier-protein] synthase family protein [Blastocatellia bacterium]|nr:beta-ketoacyl-[acyl-carrier-protein] synthase family protein [Blastocatellia bacterium]